MGIRAHATVARRCERFQFRDELAFGVKQFLRLLRAHPALENFQAFGIFLHVRHGNLVGAPEAFQLVATELSRRAPSLRTTEDNHWPARTHGNSRRSGLLL